MAFSIKGCCDNNNILHSVPCREYRTWCIITIIIMILNVQKRISAIVDYPALVIPCYPGECRAQGEGVLSPTDRWDKLFIRG